jgi:signal transduction histidine kinase
MAPESLNPRLEHEFWRLQAGDHLCWLCGGDAEGDGVLSRFIRQGIERHECVLLAADLLPERVQALAEAGGLDAAALRESGQLVCRRGPWPTGAGPPDPPAAVAALAQAAERAVRDGFHALRVAAEMTAPPGDARALERLFDYEVRLDAFLPSAPCLALCRYDRRRSDPAALLEVLPAHPRVVLESEVFDNFYYLPSGKLAGGRPAAARLRSWLSNLKERKRAETQVRMLTRQLMRSQEDERRLISRELHDRIGQDLSSVKIALDALPARPPGDPADREKMAMLSRTLDRTILTVRDLAYDLRPPGLEEMGLAKAVAMFCSEFSEKTGIRTELVSAGIEKADLDFQIAINLYRIVQEALNNIRRHARAERAVVKLTAAHPHLILRVEDDGVGFDVEKRARETDAEKRMGLRSLRERAELLGGSMIVTSRIGMGTRIFIRIPHKGWRHGRPEDRSDRR